MNKLITICAVVAMMATASVVHAAPILFDDQSDLLSVAVNPVTYDFETSSGFPVSYGYIGNFDGIGFDAQTIAFPNATSGVQGMAGAVGTPSLSIANLDFSGLSAKPIGFGFYGLDLTVSGPEVIRVNVNFTIGSTVSYDVQLPSGEPDFVPVYFGLIDAENTIESIELFGTVVGGSTQFRAWLIDDLTVVSSVIPAPSAILLGSMGMGIVGWLRRRRML